MAHDREVSRHHARPVELGGFEVATFCDQVITALAVAELLEIGHAEDDPLVTALRSVQRACCGRRNCAAL